MQYQKPEIAQLGKAMELILGGKTRAHTEPITFIAPSMDAELDD